MHNFCFQFLIAVILHRPVMVDYVAYLKNSSALQLNGTHIVLRIVNGCFSGKKVPRIAIKGHIF